MTEELKNFSPKSSNLYFDLRPLFIYDDDDDDDDDDDGCYPSINTNTDLQELKQER